MPRVKIPVNGNPYLNVDPIDITANSVALYNLNSNEVGSSKKREGLKLIKNITQSPIDGMYWWDAKQCMVAVSGGRTFYSKDEFNTVTELTGTKLNINKRVSFATDGTNLFMANGGKINWTTGTSLTQEVDDAEAPQDVTHLVWDSEYLLANNGSELAWSNQLMGTVWDSTDSIEISRMGDTIKAVIGFSGEILICGDTISEIIKWTGNTSVSIFERMTSGYIEQGIVAPYTLIKANNSYYFFNKQRKIVKLQGISPIIISTPFDKQFEDFGTVSDATMDLYEINGKTLLILSFPTEGRTFAIDYRSEGTAWGEWGYWNATKTEYERYLGNVMCYSPLWGKLFIGDRNTGNIYIADKNTYTDNSSKIRILRRTGNINHGTSSVYKMSKALFIKIKRGYDMGDLTSIPKLLIKWRDNGETEWGVECEVDLGRIGDTEWIAELSPMGTYRSRQYELIYTENTDFILSEIEEELT